MGTMVFELSEAGQQSAKQAAENAHGCGAPVGLGGCCGLNEMVTVDGGRHRNLGQA